MNPSARLPAKPLVIAHRGASALRPEHTLAAYAKGIEDGADFIEPDLIMTRDGVLVARHEVELSRSTDVAERVEFTAKRTQKTIDGVLVEGWFGNDFTLAELRRLRCREPQPDLRSRAHDGLYTIPSFDEIIELAERESHRRERLIGIIPEIKNSTWLHSAGMDPEHAIIAAIERHDYLQRAPFAIQSFEVSNLLTLDRLIGDRPNISLVQLIGDPEQSPFDQQVQGDSGQTYASMLSATGLREISHYADVVAAHVRRILPLIAETGLPGPAATWVADARALGLQVHAWTLRPENRFLPPALRCGEDPAQRCERGCIAEMQALIKAGVVGLFTDDPALGRHAVDAIGT
ncbi:MAG: glycerophosphodiester phosphodiesterase [Xanthomonadales bacterium]|nr:glycerophosphodiester phosphodiesterase [Xanthomonadales bacterium]